MKQSLLSINGLRDAVRRIPNDALTATREAALANLDEHGLPTVRDEDWKYTDLSSAIDISNRWFANGAATTSSNTLAASIETLKSTIDANWLVIAKCIIYI